MSEQETVMPDATRDLWNWVVDTQFAIAMTRPRPWWRFYTEQPPTRTEWERFHAAEEIRDILLNYRDEWKP